MNPSTKGWFDKFGRLAEKKTELNLNIITVHRELRNTGFLYGLYLKMPIAELNDDKFSSDEIAKIQLLDGLYSSYCILNDDNNYDNFKKNLLSYYKELGENVSEITSLSSKHQGYLLERIIHLRINIHQYFLTKSFQKNVANALLYLDIVAYRRWLTQVGQIDKFFFQFENYIFRLTLEIAEISESEGNTSSSIKYKTIFRDSFRHASLQSLVPNEAYRADIKEALNVSEKIYLFDLIAFICYSDLYFSKSDIDFLYLLADEIELEDRYKKESISTVKEFFRKNERASRKLDKTTYLYNFYNHSTIFIIKLIERNKKRLLKEVNKSKELINLILKSQSQPLDSEEQKRLQFLLKNIIRTIPSLAIFLLPGGVVLLPLFAKLLPSYMPDSFDDNKTS